MVRVSGKDGDFAFFLLMFFLMLLGKSHRSQHVGEDAFIM